MCVSRAGAVSPIFSNISNYVCVVCILPYFKKKADFGRSTLVPLYPNKKPNLAFLHGQSAETDWHFSINLIKIR